MRIISCVIFSLFPSVLVESDILILLLDYKTGLIGPGFEEIHFLFDRSVLYDVLNEARVGEFEVM